MSEPSSPAFTPPEPAPPRLGAASRAAAGPKAVAKTAELLGATGIVRAQYSLPYDGHRKR